MIYEWSDISVLIVEDSQINVDLMLIMLKSTKIKTFVAKDERDFMIKIHEREYDIILMDIGLPGNVDGYDLIRYIHKENIDTPIIIQSANPQCVHLFHNINEDYVEKPINFTTLFRKMNVYLSGLIT